MSEALRDYAIGWLARPRHDPPTDAAMQLEGATALVLCREPPYQVQLFAFEPGVEIPDHAHPTVSSLEFYLSGDVYIRVRGQTLYTPEMMETIASDRLRRLIAIPAGCEHGATIGPRGGSFLSFQRWPDGVTPTGVHLDWSGVPFDDRHARALQD